MYSYTSISFHKKSLVYAAHTINAKADFNSHGFFTCKIFAKSRLNSEMQRANWRGLNEIASTGE